MGRRAGFAVVGAVGIATVLPISSASAATATAQAKASVVKPLGLTATQDMDFGSLLLGSGTWSNETVSISQTGQRTCPTDIACSGNSLPARFTVTGSNNLVVTITAPDVTMVNQANSAQTLILHPNAPATVTMPNSGNNGLAFAVGGSMTLSSTTGDGNYAGTLTVTVNYQ